MCQRILKNRNQCKNKGEPYCYLHSKNSIDDTTSKESIVIKDDNTECVICYDQRSNYFTHSVCKQSICKDCIIKSGSTKCAFCRGDIDKELDSDTLSIMEYIRIKDNKVKELSNELSLMRMQLNMVMSTNISTEFIQRIANRLDDVMHPSGRIVYSYDRRDSGNRN